MGKHPGSSIRKETKAGAQVEPRAKRWMQLGALSQVRQNLTEQEKDSHHSLSQLAAPLWRPCARAVVGEEEGETGEWEA